jgi:hypothetical protein
MHPNPNLVTIKTGPCSTDSTEEQLPMKSSPWNHFTMKTSKIKLETFLEVIHIHLQSTTTSIAFHLSSPSL